MSFSRLRRAKAASSGRARPLGLFAQPAARARPALSPHARRPRPLPPRGAGPVGLNGDGPSLRDFLAERRYSRVLRRAPDRAPGLVDLVRRPRRSCGPSRPASSRSSSRTTASSRSAAGRAGARVSGGSRRYVEALVAPFAEPRSPAGAGASHRAPTRPRRPRFDDTVARLRRGRARRPLRSGARRCSPTPATPSARCSARSPTSANETVLHTDERLLPRRRAARASWNYHLTARARRPDHDHLRHEPPPVAARATAGSSSP